MSDRHERAGWSMYSWANHGWETTVSTVLIGPWLLALATAHRAGPATLLDLAGIHLKAESFPSFVVTLAALAQLAVLPSLGAASDGLASRGRWLAIACVGGSVVAILLSCTSHGEYLVAGALFIVGSVAYGASNVLYNAYLPEIAGPADRDAISSRGFAYGYVGGGLLLAANLGLLLAHSDIGLDKAAAVRICFVSAGMWWSGFGLWSLPRFRDVSRARDPDRDRSEPRPSTLDTLRLIRGMPQTRRYLGAYLLFADAISAVIGLSSTFITHELFGNSASRASTFLFALILLIQFVAMAGAVVFARIAAALGTKRALLVSLAVWCAVIIYTYAALNSKAQAVGVGIVLGTVLGGSQALARSLWSQLIPHGREAAFFGIFEVANEGTAWIAPLLFTIVVNATGSYHQAILSLIILFIAGAGLLTVTDLDAAIEEASCVH